MKSIHYFFVLITFTTVFTSCSKDDSNPGETQQSRVKTYTETIKSEFLGNHSTTFNLNYDQQGRIESMINAANSGDKFLFTYNTGGFDFDIFASGQLTIHEIVFLNAGLMDSTIQYNDEGDTTSEKYFYNGDKLLTKLNRYVRTNSQDVLDDVVQYTYDSNKRLLSESDNFSVTNYEYNGSELNNINVFPLYTSTSVALPSRVLFTSGGEQTIIDHTYTFDEKNRLTVDKAVISGTSEEVTKSFTYE